MFHIYIHIYVRTRIRIYSLVLTLSLFSYVSLPASISVYNISIPDFYSWSTHSSLFIYPSFHATSHSFKHTYSYPCTYSSFPPSFSQKYSLIDSPTSSSTFAVKRLNNSGLNGHPCPIPLAIQNTCHILSPTLSLFFVLLKNSVTHYQFFLFTELNAKIYK